MADCCYAERHLCQLKFILSCHKIGLHAECHYAECPYAGCRGAVKFRQEAPFGLTIFFHHSNRLIQSETHSNNNKSHSNCNNW